MGGAVAAIDYMKGELVAANTARLARIERGETIVVGVNKFTSGEPSPLTAGEDGILVVDPEVEADQIARLEAWRDAARRAAAPQRSTRCAPPRARAATSCPPSIEAAKAGVTTGEWGAAMREVFGEYRAPTGVAKAPARPARQSRGGARAGRGGDGRLGRRLKFLVGKPGLDGHSNGAEQIAVRARDAGMEVVYEGIRLTPAQIVNAALEESVHVVGLSILSGSHLPLVEDILERMRAAGLEDVPVVVGGIIPDADAEPCAPWASRASTRRRTSTSTASCSTSSSSRGARAEEVHLEIAEIAKARPEIRSREVAGEIGREVRARRIARPDATPDVRGQGHGEGRALVVVRVAPCGDACGQRAAVGPSADQLEVGPLQRQNLLDARRASRWLVAVQAEEVRHQLRDPEGPEDEALPVQAPDHDVREERPRATRSVVDAELAIADLSAGRVREDVDRVVSLDIRPGPAVIGSRRNRCQGIEERLYSVEAQRRCAARRWHHGNDEGEQAKSGKSHDRSSA
jgi:methylmalonyl-CoA mutase cobalamin-binding domain/chain